MLDRSRLSREEIDELTYALLDRDRALRERDRIGNAEAKRKEARWRRFVVQTLLESLDG